MSTTDRLHLFEEYLHPTEEILWISAQAEPSLWQYLRASARPYAIFLVGIFVIVFFEAREREIDPLLSFVIVALLLGVAMIPVYLFRGVRRLLRRGPERIYAVTNERLLYHNRSNKKDVLMLPYEKLTNISLFPSQAGRATLSFGAIFPIWSDIEDAESVKRIIETAHKRRIRDIDV